MLFHQHLELKLKHTKQRKRKHPLSRNSDDGVIDDKFRKGAEYQPAGDEAVEEEGGEEEEGSAEQVVEVVDEYDDAPTGADGRELAKEISDVHGTEESAWYKLKQAGCKENQCHCGKKLEMSELMDAHMKEAHFGGKILELYAKRYIFKVKIITGI